MGERSGLFRSGSNVSRSSAGSSHHGHLSDHSSLERSSNISSSEKSPSETEIALYSKSQSIYEPLSSSSALALPLRTLNDFVLLLQYSGIEGPATMIGKYEYLGQGSQFKVYKDRIVRPNERGFTTQLVAAKEPYYIFDQDHRLNLAKSSSKRPLHNMHLELMALTHPMLRAHPNVIDMIAWGREDTNWHHPLILFLELAMYDLKGLMMSRGLEMSWEQKYQISCNIAAGLDVIHECRLAHGDLKPENVLICKSDRGLVAKIADFGFCVDEDEIVLAQMAIGTPGWRAPELETGNYIIAQLALADNFTYGLVVWSVMILNGNCPPQTGSRRRSDAAVGDFEDIVDEIPISMQEPMLSVARLFLQESTLDRPVRVSDIIAAGITETGQR